MQELERQANRHWLVLGGARSGKTQRAIALAEQKTWRLYVATAEAFDAEMAERIARHKAERGSRWSTIEAPVELAQTIRRLSGDSQATSRVDDAAIVVDCLTLWLSNLIHTDRDIDGETLRLVDALQRCPVPVIMVSNEVGYGIVPDNALARAFRDAQGRLNQAVAAAVGSVELVVAGLSMRLK